jgi:hypothetical protein
MHAYGPGRQAGATRQRNHASGPRAARQCLEQNSKLITAVYKANRQDKTRLLDNREFIVGGGTQPNTEPSRGEGLDGSATAEERDNYHRDAYENARNHASGPRAAGGPLPHHTRF